MQLLFYYKPKMTLWLEGGKFNTLQLITPEQNLNLTVDSLSRIAKLGKNGLRVNFLGNFKVY